LSKPPIRVDPISLREQLDPKSRINFSKIYTVEHNTKVSFVGPVHESSMDDLRRTYSEVHAMSTSYSLRTKDADEGVKEDVVAVAREYDGGELDDEPEEERRARLQNERRFKY